MLRSPRKPEIPSPISLGRLLTAYGVKAMLPVKAVATFRAAKLVPNHMPAFADSTMQSGTGDVDHSIHPGASASL